MQVVGLAALTILAKTDNGQSDVLLWSGVLILACLVGIPILLRLRSRANARIDEKRSSFSLEELRELHRAGQLTDEEYRRLRHAALGLGEPSAGSKSQVTPAAGNDDKNHGGRGPEGPSVRPDRERK
ncbi:MAG TPA: hypothetical protein DCX07_00215 [Phycisphaerales bacterium]|nr:hypothetical protein [Phycisphaerales bacterium]